MIVEYPLTPRHRLQLARAFRDVQRVDLAIDCAIEGQMGRVFVDDPASPAVFKIESGPFAYLAGDSRAPAAAEIVSSIAPGTLLMPSVRGWLDAARERYGERLVQIERFRLAPDGLSREHLSGLCASSRHAPQVRRMDLAVAETFWRQDSFVDLAAYDSPADFCDRGIGYCLERGGRPVGAAFATLICARGIELSIYVVERYRGAGMATALAAHLLLWCLDNAVEPHWDAANAASCRLALKLGYSLLGSYHAHYLEPESSSS